MNNESEFTDEYVLKLQDELNYQKEMEEEYNKKHTKLMQKYSKQKEVLDKIKEVINHYAVEDEDYSKIYNQEEKDILELLEEPQEHKIPEKLSFILHGDDIAEIPSNEMLMNKINEILDYLEVNNGIMD